MPLIFLPPLKEQNKRDISTQNPVTELLQPPIAMLDFFIGAPDYLGKGLGSKILEQFLTQEIYDHFTQVIVDPHTDNKSAIKCYQKAGFQSIQEDAHQQSFYMLACKQTKDLIEVLEKTLLTTPVRQSQKMLNMLLADCFKEFGKSGKIYCKNDVLEELPGPLSTLFIADNFETIKLSQDIYLITYRTQENEQGSLRSSIWMHKNNGWQMVFHQGTKKQSSH